MKRHALPSLLLALALELASFQAAAIDKTVDTILDIVIQELSPELAPAKPLIVCMIDGGSAVTCAKGTVPDYAGQAKEEAKQALPANLDSPEVKLVLEIVMAAKDQKWDVVLGKGGPYVARAVICAVFVPPGVKSFGCPVIGYVIEHQAGSVKQVLDKLISGDIPGLVKFLVSQFGPDIVCELIPSSALPAGASELKDLGCSVIGEILAAAKEIADEVANALVKGADAVENLLFGDDSHMPYSKYYGLYWQPWYHYGTWLCLTQDCKGLGNLNASIGDPCVEYFDSHNQYKSTAEKTCGNMRDRFDKEVKAFRSAMLAAGTVYHQTAITSAKSRAVSDWSATWDSTASRKKEFAAKCEGDMKSKFLFPAPNPGACEFIKKSPIYKNKTFQPLLDKQYNKCVANAAKQMPSPTAWAHVCLGPADKFAAEYATAKKGVADTVKQLEALGCTKEQKSMAVEPKLSCSTYPGYDACKSAYAGQLPCALADKKADTALADQILAQLGSKRCKIQDEAKTQPCPKKDGTLGTCLGVEKNILCSRPWKVDKCKDLLSKLAAGHLSSSVHCKGDAAGLAEFAKLEGQASAIRNQLNGGSGPIGTKPGYGDAKAKSSAGTGSCKTAESDTLKIHCPGGEFAVHPEINLPTCPVDPNLDGADAPCRMLFLEITKQPDIKAPKQFDPVVGDVYQGPAPGGSAKPPTMSAPPVMTAPPVLAPAAPAIAPAPGIVPPPATDAATRQTAPAVIGPPPGMVPAASVPGCAPVPGAPGQFACATREAYAGCERMRASGMAGIRHCGMSGARSR